jgi:hypothetical protein
VETGVRGTKRFQCVAVQRRLDRVVPRAWISGVSLPFRLKIGRHAAR